jgi:hypothetical protein
MTGYKSKRAAAQDKLDNMEREALKLALDALEQTLETLDDENAKPGGAIADTIWYSEHITLFDYLASEITAIKEVLTQPAQEPVAWMNKHGDCKSAVFREAEAGAKEEYNIPLYTNQTLEKNK